MTHGTWPFFGAIGNYIRFGYQTGLSGQEPYSLVYSSLTVIPFFLALFSLDMIRLRVSRLHFICNMRPHRKWVADVRSQRLGGCDAAKNCGGQAIARL